MSKQYPGGVISKSGVVPTSLSAPGIWSLSDQAAAQATNSWPFVRDPQFNYVTMLLQGDGSATTNNGRGAGVTPVVTPFNSDASTNNFNLSITGDAKPNNFNPYQAGYYSNYFDRASTQYLTVSNSGGQFSFGTGAFTIECWINLASLPSGTGYPASYWLFGGGPVNSNTGIDFYINNTQIGFNLTNFTSPTAIGNHGMSVGTWYHVAVVRGGTSNQTLSIYVNGSRVATASGVTATADAATTGIAISAAEPSGATSGNFDGYISNHRIVKGTAVYDPTQSALTVPTTSLTAVANTQLLTCQSSRFIDNSTNALTITVNGTPSVSPAQPFTLPSSVETYGSAYFDASGDYLTTNTTSISLGTNNFTMECWVYPTTSGDQIVFDGRSGSNSNKPTLGVISLQLAYQTSGANRILAGSVPQNAWSHLAIVRNSNVIYAYINGVQVGTYSDSSDYGTVTRLRVGCDDDGGPSAFFGGYISNARLVTSAVYTGAFTPSTTPLTAITNTQLLTTQYNGAGNNSGFKDSSQNNFIIARNGNTAQGTFSPYGSNWSNYFGGSSDFLTMPDNANYVISGDFTVEAWIYPTSFAGTNGNIVLAQWPGATATNQSFQFYVNSTGKVGLVYGIGATNAAVVGTSLSCTLNTWNHVAVTRSGTTVRYFVNGALDATSATVSGAFNNSTGVMSVGRINASDSGYFSGYISNCRLVIGTALYTSAFTPSTTPLTAISGTQVLVCQANRFSDASSNNATITVNGSPSVQRFSPFVNSIAYNTNNVGGSAYFDGSGDSLKVAYGPQMNLTNQDFAVEFWAYIPTALTNKSFLCQDQGYYQLNFFVDASNNLTVYSYQASTALNFSVSFGAVPIGQWVHIALTRTGSTVAGFLNGVRQNTASFSGSIDAQTGGWYVGSAYSNTGHMTGYLSDVRFTIGANPHGVGTTLTVPTAPLTASSNTQFLGSMTNAGIIDNAMMNDLETVGNAQISTSVKKYGSGSIYFDGSGDGLVANGVASSGAYDKLTASGVINTVEFWLYLNAFTSPRAFLCGSWASSVGWTYDVNTSGDIFISTNGSGPTVTLSSKITTGTWQHLAFVNDGTNIKIYLNGTNVGTQAVTAPSSYIGPLTIGMRSDGSLPLNGYIDDLRITKNVARYTANFTPPTESFRLG